MHCGGCRLDPNRIESPFVFHLTSSTLSTMASRLMIRRGLSRRGAGSQLRLCSEGRAPLPPTPRVPPPKLAAPAAQPESAYARSHNRTPVSWRSLFLAGVTAASAVAYFQIERERRLEQAMGKVVTSESTGWTPRPGYLAEREYVPTKWGWFPKEDAFGACEWTGRCWNIDDRLTH